uniref:Pentatricopeptide repeat-containing protein At4g38150 isoform X1 n=1 Tax=Rhizophora mucronata TaxID=61149 RepID=A0A2P2J450_RHIMU
MAGIAVRHSSLTSPSILSSVCIRNWQLCISRLAHFPATTQSPQRPLFLPPLAIPPPFTIRVRYSYWLPPPPPNYFCRLFCSEATEKKKIVDTKVNFSLSDSDDVDEETTPSAVTDKKEIDKSKLPPPYDPFNKKPAIEEPEDPRDLQMIFHKMRSEGGLIDYAVKMFDSLSKDGLTHEALELFSQIKDKGHMPDVVGHTAVIEAYAKAGRGQSKEALRVFLRMLASGVAPNAYTYTVLIKGLAKDGKLSDAMKYLVEMMGKGMQPNARTYTAVFEAFAREQKVDEAKEFLQQLKATGFVPDEKAVREALSDKRGQVFRTVINVLFNK